MESGRDEGLAGASNTGADAMPPPPPPLPPLPPPRECVVDGSGNGFSLFVFRSVFSAAADDAAVPPDNDVVGVAAAAGVVVVVVVVVADVEPTFMRLCGRASGVGVVSIDVL
jgi:hypothetical protein